MKVFWVSRSSDYREDSAVAVTSHTAQQANHNNVENHGFTAG